MLIFPYTCSELIKLKTLSMRVLAPMISMTQILMMLALTQNLVVTSLCLLMLKMIHSKHHHNHVYQKLQLPKPLVGSPHVIVNLVLILSTIFHRPLIQRHRGNEMLIVLITHSKTRRFYP